MIRGILFKLEYPYAHFGTVGVTADLLYPIVWEAVRILESDDVKVLCITADGASPNRKFFRMHKTNDLSIPYKASYHMQKMIDGYTSFQTLHILSKLVGHTPVLLVLDTCRYMRIQ